MAYNSLMVFTGNANPKLAADVAAQLNVDLGRANVGRFSDGEVSVELQEHVRGRDIFVLQSTCAPCNDNLMELLVIVDSLKRASAGRITATIPYFGYARQDRRSRSSRVPIAAKLVANMLVASGVDRVLTMDLHAEQIQGFFDIPVDNIYALPILLADIQKQHYENPMVVSPDHGGVVRARSLAKRPKLLLLDEPFGMLDSLTRWDLQEVLMDVWSREKLTAMVITHDVDEAILLADRILAHVDFLSVGTNDLAQYTMAADRMEGQLSDLLDPWQPAVLQVIGHACDGAKLAGKPMGVCGEAGGDPLLALVLTGLGVASLSMGPSKVAIVRYALSLHTLAECHGMATAALAQRSAQDAHDAVCALADPSLVELL